MDAFCPDLSLLLQICERVMAPPVSFEFGAAMFRPINECFASSFFISLNQYSSLEVNSGVENPVFCVGKQSIQGFHTDSFL